jgi:integrase
MGRKRTGSIRQVGVDSFEVRLAGATVGTFSEDEAQRKLKSALAADSGTAVLGFDEWSEVWWDRREQLCLRRKRARGIKKDRSRWRMHVASAPFYHLPLKRQTVAVLQAWIDDLSQTEAVQTITRGRGENKKVEYRKTGRLLSRKVISEALNLVQLCFDAAIRAGKLSGLIVDGKITAGNPARMVLLPPEEVQQRDGQRIIHLVSDEIDEVFELDLDTFQRAVFAIAIYEGLRRGEIWGLRWQNVIFDDLRGRNELQIRWSYSEPTKTRNSRREVPMLPPVVAALKAWRAENPNAIGDALVFPNEDGKCFSEGYDAGWRTHYQRHRNGKPYETPGVRAQAGIRKEVAFKELRHTCGCHLAQGTWMEQRFDLHDIKTWMGHSSVAVTERHYAFLTTGNLHERVQSARYVGNKWVASK